jgi:hypothetical protein
MSIAATEIRLDKRVKSFVKERRKLLIDGKWDDAASGKTFPVENPATGEVIGRRRRATRKISTVPSRRPAGRLRAGPGQG